MVTRSKTRGTYSRQESENNFNDETYDRFSIKSYLTTPYREEITKVLEIRSPEGRLIRAIERVY